MLPSWAHAYSHRMMKSYKCDTSQEDDKDVAAYINDKIISFNDEGEGTALVWQFPSIKRSSIKR